jgi:photosystem II stability/assembly factor-like uncharacterized protein
MPLMKPLPPSLAVLLLLCSASLVQGVPVPGERWSPVGPQGGTVTALAVAPGARRTLYAGTAEGVVFRSEDAGARWAYAGGLLPAAQVADLDVDPRSPATAYAAICLSEIEPPSEEGGLFKTTDGGRTWRLLDLGLTHCTILEVAVDPFAPSTLFAATLEGLFQSEDTGATWQRSPNFPSDHQVHQDDIVTAVAFDPATPGTLYAIHRRRGLHKSVDGGATWAGLGTGLPAARDLLGLEIDPRTPGTLYIAASDARGVPNPAIAPVYRSVDGGATWAAAARGLGGRRVFDLAAARATLYAATVDGVFRSQDGGRRWTAPGAGAARSARNALVLAAPAGPPGVVYAGALHQGVFKSTDRGTTFRGANRGLHGVRVDHLAIAPSNPAVLYAVLRGRNVHRSDDGGATWRPAHAGLPVDPYLIAVDPRDPDTALASQYAGHIWKTADGGASWRLTTGEETSCVLPNEIVFDPRQRSTVYTLGFGILCPLFPDVCRGFKSTDGGESWSCMDELADDYFALAIDPADPSRLFAGGLGEVLATADAGRNWAGIGPGLPAGSFVSSLALAASGGARVLYAGTSDGLFRQTGAGWTRVQATLFTSVTEVAAAPSNPAVVYALHRARPYRSVNGGATWRRVTLLGLPADPLAGVIVHPTQPRVLYTVTRAGIYRLSPTPAGLAGPAEP